MIVQPKEVLQHLAENIYHSLVVRKQKELSHNEWENLCACLNLFSNPVYCIDSIEGGFVIKTKRISFIYKHAPVRYLTEVAVKKNSYAIPVKPPFKTIELRIHAIDGLGETNKTFFNVQELAEFLKDNEVYAQALGYVPKRRAN